MKNLLFKDMLKISGGATIAQILGILSLPILSRIYSPEEFGIYAIFFALSNILLILSTWRYELAIILPKKDEDSINIMILILVILSFMFSLFVIVILYFGDTFTILLRVPELNKYIWAIPIHIFISGIYQSFKNLNSRNKNFSNIAKSNIINSGSTYVLQISLGVTFLRETGLIFGSIIGLLIATIYFLIKSLRYFHKDFIKIKGIKKVFLDYKNFPIFTIWGSLLSGVGLQLPVFLLSSFFGPIYSGFYSLANRAISLPTRIIGEAISEVSYKHTSDIIKDNKNLPKYIEKSTAAIFQVSFVPFIIVLFLGRQIFTLILGANWEIAGFYVQILSPLIFLRLFSSPINIFYQKKRNDLFFIWQLGFFVFSFLGIYLGYLYKSSNFSLILFSSLLSFCYIVLIYANFRLAGARLKNVLFNIKNTLYIKELLS